MCVCVCACVHVCVCLILNTFFSSDEFYTIVKINKMADAFVKWNEMVERIVVVGRVEAASRPAVKKALAEFEQVPEGLIYESGMNPKSHT